MKITHITPDANSAARTATELLNRTRMQRFTDRHGNRHGWDMRAADVVEICGGLADVDGLGFTQIRGSRDDLRIRTDAGAAEIVLRLIRAGRTAGNVIPAKPIFITDRSHPVSTDIQN